MDVVDAAKLREDCSMQIQKPVIQYPLSGIDRLHRGKIPLIHAPYNGYMVKEIPIIRAADDNPFRHWNPQGDRQDTSINEHDKRSNDKGKGILF